ncbi:MAG: TonB-dependent receptor plug domain-containing protein, partial [Opitutaceae bacterium]
MKYYQTILRLSLGALAATAVASAQTKPSPTKDETISLEKFVVQSVAAPTANTIADRQQIALQPAAASVINVIKYLPGVSLSQGDAIGGDDWSTRINIRGFTESQLGFSVDGVTTGYTSYGGGAKPNRYVDIENVANVVVSQGAAEISSASTQALGGTLSYYTDTPSDQMGVLAKFTGGSFALSRSFIRVDTGKILDGTTQAFISFSAQQNDNWVRDYIGGDSALTKRLHLDTKVVSQVGKLK